VKSPHSSALLLHLPGLPASIWLPSRPRNFLKAVGWGNCNADFVWVFCLRDHWPFIAWFLYF
jgi:hypothetical protein